MPPKPIISLTRDCHHIKLFVMRKWFKLGFASLTITLAVSCGASNSVIFNTLSLAPRSFVEESKERSSMLAMFVFDVPKMREQLGITRENPKGAEIGLGILTSKPFPTGTLPESFDSMKMQGFLSCPTYSMQAFTNTAGLNQYLSEKGFAQKTEDGVSIYALKMETNKLTELPQFCTIGDKGAVQIDRGDMGLGISAKETLSGKEDSALSYPFVSDIANALSDYPAMALVFPVESFLMRINGGGITSGLYGSWEQSDMVDQFKIWGRSHELEMVGIGSRMINNTEQVRFCFQYKTPEAASQDLDDLKIAVRSTPSLITGKIWMKNLKLTDPIFSMNGRQVFMDCDFEGRNQKEPFAFHRLFGITANLYDWGILWKK